MFRSQNVYQKSKSREKRKSQQIRILTLRKNMVKKTQKAVLITKLMMVTYPPKIQMHPSKMLPITLTCLIKTSMNLSSPMKNLLVSQKFKSLKKS